MRVRLIKKFAERIDGIDLSTHQAGDTFDLDRPEARLLIAEGWALPERRAERHYMSADSHPPPTFAADRRKGRRGRVS